MQVTAIARSAGAALYDNHVPTSSVGKVVLAARAAMTAMIDPERQDAVAALGEATGHQALTAMYRALLRDPMGRKLLRDRPVVNSETLSFDELLKLPLGSFGREHAARMTRDHLTADSRLRVRYVDHPDLAYVMQRYREVHDFWHTLTEVPTSIEGELALKWFEWVQTGLPMNALASIVGPLRLAKRERTILFEHYVPWALRAGAHAQFLLAVKYEDLLARPLVDVQRELRVIPAPQKF